MPVIPRGHLVLPFLNRCRHRFPVAISTEQAVDLDQRIQNGTEVVAIIAIAAGGDRSATRSWDRAHAVLLVACLGGTRTVKQGDGEVVECLC